MPSEVITYLTIAFISFIAGLFAGYFTRLVFEKEKISLSPNNFVLICVTLIWTISMVVDIASPQYETSPLLHGLMGAIVGFFFQPWRRNDEEGKN